MRTATIGLLSAIVINLLSGAAFSQCGVASLNLSTGYNPSTNSLVSVDDADPIWIVTSLSGNAENYAPYPLPYDPSSHYPAFAISPDGSWTTTAAAQWISFFTGNAYPTAYTSGNQMTVERAFIVDAAGYFSLDLYVASDDPMDDLQLDGYPIYTPGIGAASLDHVTWSGYFTAGVHYLAGFVQNSYYYSDLPANPHGFILTGTVSSDNESSTLSNPSCAARAASAPVAVEKANFAVLQQKTTTKTIHSSLASVGNLYPNPATDKITVPVNSAQSGIATIRILSMSGAEAGHKEYSIAAGVSKLEMQLSALPSGMYLAEVSGPWGKVVKHFVQR